MARLRPRRLRLGAFLYEVDAEALAGSESGGVYRVGRRVRVEKVGYVFRPEPRTEVRGELRLRVIGALLAEEKRRKSGRVPSAKELGRTTRAIRRRKPEDAEEKDRSGRS